MRYLGFTRECVPLRRVQNEGVRTWKRESVREEADVFEGGSAESGKRPEAAEHCADSPGAAGRPSISHRPSLIPHLSSLILHPVFVLAFCIAAAFALATNHAWEDYYITFRVSKNLATGRGPVFTPGERVHAFTSPLNMLLPAALSYATGNRSDAAVLWLFRVISAASFAGARHRCIESHHVSRPVKRTDVTS